MYTLEQLQQKTFGELKAIGWELNVLPEDDRRRRQSWIDALVNVNPPLLQLLEVSPAAPVEQVQEPIIETVDASPGVEADQRQEPPIESKFGRIVYPQPTQNGNKTDKTDTDRVGAGSAELHNPRHIDTAESDASSNSLEIKVDRSQICDQLLAIPGDSKRDRRQALLHWSVELVTKTSPGVEVDQVEEPLPDCVVCFGDGYIEEEFARIKFCRCEPKLSHQKTQRAIVPVAKNLPGSRSKTSTAHQLLELFKSSAHIIEDAPGVKTEETVSESAIVPAVEKLPRSEPDPNPILTGIPLSDRFVARYSPPQPENIHFKADTDGQLNLLDF